MIIIVMLLLELVLIIIIIIIIVIIILIIIIIIIITVIIITIVVVVVIPPELRHGPLGPLHGGLPPLRQGRASEVRNDNDNKISCRDISIYSISTDV